MKTLTITAAVLLVVVVAYAQVRSSRYTDAQIEAALVKHENTSVLYLAAASVQGTDGMGGMSFETWWRLCEGRWTKGVQEYLPGLTDRQFGAMLKRYGQRQKGRDPRSIISPKERGQTIMPGESVTLTIE